MAILTCRHFRSDRILGHCCPQCHEDDQSQGSHYVPLFEVYHEGTKELYARVCCSVHCDALMMAKVTKFVPVGTQYDMIL